MGNDASYDLLLDRLYCCGVGSPYYRIQPPMPYKANNCNEATNCFGLTPGQVNHLRIYFNQYAGREGRLFPCAFRKMIQDSNPCIRKCDAMEKSKLLFKVFDTNGDGQVSFDEFVDGYCNFKAAQCLNLRAYNGAYGGYGYPLDPIANPEFERIALQQVKLDFFSIFKK